MIDEREVEKGLQWCVDNAARAGEVKSTLSHLERFTKVLKAKLMRQSGEKVVWPRKVMLMLTLK